MYMDQTWLLVKADSQLILISDDFDSKLALIHMWFCNSYLISLYFFDKNEPAAVPLPITATHRKHLK
mgnify:CR=1 FL=1